MPLPSTIQGTDTFNTWLDATNNLISHVANTNQFVLVNNVASVGNVAIDGSVTTGTLVANANVVLGGSSLLSTTPILRLTTNASNINTVAMFGTNLTIAMTNTVMSGTDLSIGQNTVIQGRVTIGGLTSISANTTLSGFVATTTNTSANVVSIGANVVTVTINTSASWYTANAVVYTTNAVNTFIVGTNLTLGANTTVTGLLFVNSTTTTFNGNTTFNANVIFNTGVSLGGPTEWKSTFIANSVSPLSGAGEATPLAIDPTTTVFRILSSVANKVISGIQQANTAQYRQLVVFNISDYDVFFQHANSAAGANGVWCPGNTNFMIPSQGTALLYYDANTSIQRWRVISAPIAPIANSTVNGYMSISAQTFAGAKTFSAAVNALSTLGVSGAVNALSTLGVAGASTFNGTLTVANTVDLNTSTYGRLVLPVGTNKWSA